MDEVGGAVQRIDDPDVVRFLIAELFAAFLAQNAMLWVGTQQGFDDDALGSLIYFSDEVIDLLLGDTNRFHVQRSAVDDGASGARSLDGHVEHGVQGGRRHKLCSWRPANHPPNLQSLSLTTWDGAPLNADDERVHARPAMRTATIGRKF